MVGVKSQKVDLAEKYVHVRQESLDIFYTKQSPQSVSSTQKP